MKLSLFVAALGWASLFGLSWMMLLGTVPASVFTWFFWGVYLVVAVLASIISTNPAAPRPGRKL